MAKLRYRDLLGWAAHPAEEDLLSALDSELPAQKAERIRRHLEGCWRCRARQEELENSIAETVGELNALLSDAAVFPPQAQPQFADKLRQLALETEPHPLFLNLFTSVSGAWSQFQLSLKLAAGLAACLLILILLIPFVSSPVSAREFLRRTQEAETQRLQQVAAPVIYRKFQVRRRASRHEAALSWESWNDLSNSRFKQRVEDEDGPRFIPEQRDAQRAGSRPREPLAAPPILLELEQIFERNQIDRRQPLSPAAYEAWRRSIRLQTEEVVETTLAGGDKALALRTVAAGPFAVNRIIEAKLIVRAADWHPVEQHLKVQAEREVRTYELTETAFEVVALNTLPPAIFADLSPPTSAAAPAPVPAPTMALPAPSAAPAAAPSATELLAAEIEAHYALHRIKACLGEPVEVARDAAGQLQVRGLAATEQRKEEILAALQAVRWLTLSVQTIAEAQAAASRAGSPVITDEQNLHQSPEPPAREFKSGQPPMQDGLERYFTAHPELGPLGGEQRAQLSVQQKIAILTREAVSRSDATLREAWALRRLAERYPPKKLNELPLTSRWLLQQMALDHLGALNRATRETRSLLSPILLSLLDAEASAALAEDKLGEAAAVNPGEAAAVWNAVSLGLFDQTERTRVLIHGLFAGAGLEMKPAEAARSLLFQLAGLENEFQRLQAQVAREFAR